MTSIWTGILITVVGTVIAGLILHWMTKSRSGRTISEEFINSKSINKKHRRWGKGKWESTTWILEENSPILAKNSTIEFSETESCNIHKDSSYNNGSWWQEGNTVTFQYDEFLGRGELLYTGKLKGNVIKGTALQIKTSKEWSWTARLHAQHR